MHVRLRVRIRVWRVCMCSPVHTHVRMCVYACGVRSEAHSCTHMCVCAWSVRVGAHPSMCSCVRFLESSNLREPKVNLTGEKKIRNF